MGAAEDARARQRLFSDYAPRLQHGARRVHRLVPARAAARLLARPRSAHGVHHSTRRLGSSSIIIRMSGVRKLAAEAADNGLLAPEPAAGIARVTVLETRGAVVDHVVSPQSAHEPCRAQMPWLVRGPLATVPVALPAPSRRRLRGSARLAPQRDARVRRAPARRSAPKAAAPSPARAECRVALTRGSPHAPGGFGLVFASGAKGRIHSGVPDPSF